jgi:TetR/AcrR family transcriptional repressor of nem operon
MGSEIVRADVDARRAATQGFETVVGILADSNDLKEDKAAQDEALFIMSSIIGALTMARIVDDPSLSSRILDAAKERLANAGGKPKRKTAKPRVA